MIGAVHHEGVITNPRLWSDRLYQVSHNPSPLFGGFRHVESLYCIFIDTVSLRFSSFFLSKFESEFCLLS